MFQPNFVTFTSTDITERKPLEGKFTGNQNDGFTFVQFADGSGGLEKSMKDWVGNKTGRLYRAEILAAQEYLAAQIGKAMNAPVRDCYFTSPTTVIMPFINGTPANEQNETELPHNAQGTALRLFDYFVANADRRPKNWIITSDNRIVGIDHALCNFRPRVPSAEFVAEMWNNGLTLEGLERLRPKFAALVVDFTTLGMADKHATLMANFDRLLGAFQTLNQVAVVVKDVVAANKADTSKTLTAAQLREKAKEAEKRGDETEASRLNYLAIGVQYDEDQAKEVKKDALTPPKGVQEAAQRALGWLKEGKAGSGFTPVGRKRASDLAHAHPISLDTLKRMKAYFDRHQPDQKAEGFQQGEKGYPSHGRVAWDAWGGDAGYAWAKSVVERNTEKSFNYNNFIPKKDEQSWGYLGEGITVPKQPAANAADAMALHALNLRRKQQYESAQFAHQDAAKMYRDMAEKASGAQKELWEARAKEQDEAAKAENFADVMGEGHSPSEINKGDVQGHPFHGNQYESGEGGWKPVMTSAEAMEWAKNSAIQVPLYHGTNKPDSIMSEGFRDNTGGGNFINGTYLNDFDPRQNENEVQWGLHTLTVMANVKSVATPEQTKAITAKVEAMFWEPHDHKINPGDEARKIALEQGFDALQPSKGVYIVLNPKNLTVVSDEVKKGDVVGHEFHGNQYTDANGHVQISSHYSFGKEGSDEGAKISPEQVGEILRTRDASVEINRLMGTTDSGGMVNLMTGEPSLMNSPLVGGCLLTAQALKVLYPNGEIKASVTTSKTHLEYGIEQGRTPMVDHFVLSIGKDRFLDARGEITEPHVVDLSRSLWGGDPTPMSNGLYENHLIEATPSIIEGAKRIMISPDGAPEQFAKWILEQASAPVVVPVPKSALHDPVELVKSVVNFFVRKGDVVGHEFHGNQYVQVAGVGNLSNRASGTRYRDAEHDVLYRYFRGNQGRQESMFGGPARYAVALKPEAQNKLIASHTAMMRFHEQQAKMYKDILAKGGLDAKTQSQVVKAIEAHENASNAHADAASLQTQKPNISGGVNHVQMELIRDATETSRSALKDGLAAEKLDDTLAHLHTTETGETKAVVVDKKFNDPKYLNTILPEGWTAAKGPTATIELTSATTGNTCTVKNNSATSESAWNFGHHGEAINQMLSHLDGITTNVHLDLTSRKEFAGELGFVNAMDPSIIHLSGPQGLARASQATAEGDPLVGEARISAVVPQKPWDMTADFNGTAAKDVWTVGLTRSGVESVFSTINHELGHTDYFRNQNKFTDLLPSIAELSQDTSRPMTEKQVRDAFDSSVANLAAETVSGGYRRVALPAYGSTPSTITSDYSEAKQYFLDTQVHKIELGSLKGLMGDLGVTEYGRSNWHETVAEMRSAWLAKDVTPPPLARKMAEVWGWDNPLKKAAAMSLQASKSDLPKGEYILIPIFTTEAPDGTEVVWSNLGWVDPKNDTFYTDINFDTSVLAPYAFTNTQLAQNADDVVADLTKKVKDADASQKAVLMELIARVKSIAVQYRSKD
jgi:hypothetical protein